MKMNETVVEGRNGISRSPDEDTSTLQDGKRMKDFVFLLPDEDPVESEDLLRSLLQDSEFLSAIRDLILRTQRIEKRVNRISTGTSENGNYQRRKRYRRI